MKYFSYLLLISLSFVAFDFKILRRRQVLLSSAIEESREFENLIKKGKNRNRVKKYKNSKHKKNKLRANKKIALHSKSKSHRYSNHKMLRRMYRND